MRRTHSIIAGIALSACALLARAQVPSDPKAPEPYVVPDYVALWTKIVEEAQPGDDGREDARPLVQRAAKLYDEVEREIEERFPGKYFFPEALSRRWASWENEDDKRVARVGYDLLVERGFFALTRQIRESPRYDLSDLDAEDVSALQTLALEDLGRSRRLAVLCDVRFNLALEEGDVDEAREALADLLALARFIVRGRTVIHLLVGISIDALALESIRDHVSRERLDAKTADVLRDLLVSLASLDTNESMWRVEALFVQSRIESLFVPDHRGDGRLLLSEFGWFKVVFPRFEYATGYILNDGLIEGPVWISSIVEAILTHASLDYLGPLAASRSESFSALDEYYALVNRLMASEIDRGTMERAIRAHLEDLSNRHLVTKWMIERTIGPFGKRLEGLRLIESQHRAVVLMLGIEMHIDRRGALPESLDELVPDVLAELPLDPYSREPFRYRLATDADRQFVKRGYVLYSVGLDGIDHGGRVEDANEYRPVEALVSGGSGSDYIANFVKPE